MKDRYKKHMNILLFSRIVAKSGVGNHMKQLSEELVRQGHKVTVISSTNDLGIGGDDTGVRFVKMPVSRDPVTIIRGIGTLRRVIRAGKIDIVHCHHRMAALYMRIYRMFYRIPVVYTLHLADIPADMIHRMFTFVGDRAIGVSSEVSGFLIRDLRIPEEKVVTVLNGVDEKQLLPLSEAEKEEIYEKWDLPHKRTVFALHSRIDAVKNHLLVAEAAAAMPDEYRRRVVFVCSGKKEGEYYDRLVRKISEYGLDDNFRFTGWAATREVIGIADALVLPSVNEGFPLSAAEAFLMKKPVFRTKTAGFSDQKYCSEIPADDPKKVAKVLTDFMDNGSRMSVEEAYGFAMDNMTLAGMTEKTVDVYRGVI